MPVIIPADRWEINAEEIGPEYMLNHGPSAEINTEKIIESINEIEERQEMKELDRLLMASPFYLHGKNNG